MLSALFWAICLGVLAGTVFLYLGYTHETQSEFHRPSGVIDYRYSLEVFGSWFVLGALTGLVAYGAYYSLNSFRKRHR